MQKVWEYVKKHRFDILVSLSVAGFLIDVIIRRHLFSYSVIVLYAMGYFVDRENVGTNIEERKRLRLRGLTPADLRNIRFVQKWEETRKGGMAKYVFVYGAIFFGFALCCIFSFFALMLDGELNRLKQDPANMFNLIGYTYAAGFIAAALIYRFFWAYNERKFINLTDPLH